MNPVYEHLLKNEPVIFMKFGDGEYLCASGAYGSNCDGDPYNQRLSEGLKNSIKYYSTLKNTYLGTWHTENVSTYFSSLTMNKINWVDYHTFIIDNKSLETNDKCHIYKIIKEIPRKKIIIGNELLVKAKSLLNIETHIVVPYRNWFENNFDNILNSIINTIGVDENPLILTSCGMGAKVLIAELHKKKPNGIYIDIGSGLDFLCTKKSSRGHDYNYETLENYFYEILPEDWNDPKYNWIYELAKYNIGIHL